MEHDILMSDGVRSCMQKSMRRRDMSERVDAFELATTGEHDLLLCFDVVRWSEIMQSMLS
jgi:hypothetical protein